MPAIEWSDKYTNGILNFDAHHKRLFDLLNKLYDEHTCGDSPDAIRDIIIELLDYTVYHFKAEEKWLSEIKYPKLSEHCKEHGIFSEKLSSLIKKGNGDLALSSDLLKFLSNWLANHILRSDFSYSQYFTAVSCAG